MAIALVNASNLNCLQILREHQNNYLEAVDFIVNKYKAEMSASTVEAIRQAVHGYYLRNFMIFTPSGYSEALNYLQAHCSQVYAAVGPPGDRYTTQQIIQLIMLRDYPDLLPELGEYLAQFV